MILLYVVTNNYVDNVCYFRRCGYCLKPGSFEFFSIDKGKHSDRVYFFLPEDGKVTPDAQPATAEAADICGLEAEGSWLYMLYE